MSNFSSPQVLCTGFDRPNLYYKVKKKSADKFDDISKAINNENKIFNIENGSIIIYCLTKKMTEEIADILKCMYVFQFVCSNETYLI